MGVEFTLINNNMDKEAITISSKEFNYLRSYFDELNRQTGVMIDGYNDIRLSPEHSGFLIDLMSSDKHMAENVKLKKLLKILDYAKKNKEWIYIIGE